MTININLGLKNKLKDFGLHPSEIRLYLFLLENGVQTVSEISKGTETLRTNCYGIVKSLLDKGLVQSLKQSGVKKYTANNPQALLRSIEDKKRMVADDLVPELLNIFKSQKNKPIIKFYEGKEEVKEIFLQMYEAKEIFGFTSTKKLLPFYPKFFVEWRSELKRRGIFLKDMLTESSKDIEAKQVKEELGVFFENRIVPAKFGDVASDILVWNDNIALITLDEPIFGTVINNPELAQTFRVMFSIMWRSLGQDR